MRVVDYMKEKVGYLCFNVLLFSMLTFVLLMFHTNYGLLLLLGMVWFVPLLMWFVIDYSRKRSFYQTLVEGYERLDQKYLLQEIIKEPTFIEGNIVYEVLKDSNRYFLEELKRYEAEQIEYREYIETWVHEIKTPIAATKLILENQGTMLPVKEELDRVEDYVEQVLYYARSTQANKDYVVRPFALQEVINEVLKKHAKSFIYKKIRVELEGLEEIVYSDRKWIQFMVSQIITNSINYGKGIDDQVRIYTKVNKENTVLVIEDSGVGIEEKDIPRIFQKGFTGVNGRLYGKSTGMGLYLCKKLSEKLYLGLEVKSEVGRGTKVLLVFPKNLM